MIKPPRGLPGAFWALFWGSLFGNVGDMMVRPFLALYTFERLGVSAASAGGLVALSMVSRVLIAPVSGSLVDRFGRRPMLLTGLAAGALAFGGFALAGTVPQFVALSLLLGAGSSLYTPAAGAAVADLVEPGRRAQGYGLIRVSENVGGVVGPLVGALIARSSYKIAFGLAALADLVFLASILLLVPETRPGAPRSGHGGSDPGRGDPGGYRELLRDRALLSFLGVNALVWMTYHQVFITMPIFLKTERGIGELGFGALMTLNGILVVLLQLPAARLAERGSPGIALALAASAIGAGMGVFAFSATMAWFSVGMVVATLGEIVWAPTGSKLVADLAPERLRGRYMGALNLASAAATAAGPPLGGLVLTLSGGTALWTSAAALCFLAAGLFPLVGRAARAVSTPGRPRRSG